MKGNILVDQSSDQLLQLVYASAATVDFAEEQLDSLLEVARRKNSAVDITGVLLYCDNSFFQVLEGPESAVRSVYSKISEDKRHDRVLVLAENFIAERNFGDWSMGFLRDQVTVSQMPGFVDFFNGRTFVDLHGDSNRIKIVLDGFKRGRWHRGQESFVA